MAQPPEAAPFRLQSSLDSAAPGQPRVQPNLDAPVEQKHPPQGQQQQPHPQQHDHHPQQQHRPHQQPQHHQPHPAPLGAQPPSAPHSSSSSSSSSVAHSTGTRARHSPGIDNEKTRADGVLPADASPNNLASIARPADPTPTVHSAQSDAQHNGIAPGPAPSDMANTHPGPGPARQPVTYASPPAYPPAGMSPVSQYMYSTQSIPSDPYRPSPTTLPSMRTLDHRQPQPQPQHGIPLGAHMAGPTMPAPAPAHMGYYGVHPSHMYGLPDPNAMRFALAPGMAHDPRIALSGGRHKKEIKRRTKTGCLTCRKRRIKCDEAHPTCNNCKKSKRECLGYDPIFKQQHGPAAIQPAPSTQPTAAPPTAVPAPAVPSSASHPYPASYPPSLPSTIVPDSVASTTPQSIKTEPSYDYSTAIDPALQGADTAGSAGTRAPRYHQSNAATGAGQGIGDSNDLRAKKMKVDELVALGSVPPQPPSAPPSAETLAEITNLYTGVYAPGLALFFETRWYDLAKTRPMTANPAAMLHNNQFLVSLFASFIQTISEIKSTDPGDMILADHLESSVVWSLARLPLSITLTQREQYPESGPAEDDPWEARGRLQVFETLLAGETLAANPLSPPPAGNIHPLRRNEFGFWHQLANYLLQDHASASPTDVSTRERCLGVMRDLLDGRENRDVLYSIAVLREYTAHWDASYSEQNVPSHLEESDPRSKLAVATRFIRDESSMAGGTTNVVRRFADLAYRAFVRPGVNVNRNRGRG
ncbi:hypothetical protein C8A01DRAFT_15835 [Parachaetomium inaequale]|uniref:Zn(2)-C6 fungal-type domain-containing protein n=1 Tax=Parachaetomium inaequale TaxID=2588326 RepID=A0AAN6PJN4_9PEZI|nr:hypothetical protein C8A01DRAFT_15835 [Parachaetomium inaequale]